MADDPKLNTFRRLNRFLLWLVTFELGYFILCGLICLLVWLLIGVFKAPIFERGLAGDINKIIGIALVVPFQISYCLNLFGAFYGLILVLRNNAKESSFVDWTGYIFNWVYVVTTSWLQFLLFMQAAFSVVGRMID